MAAQQGTAEWKIERAGHVTASRVVDVLARIKTGEAAARRDYRAQLVSEILTGVPQENSYTSAEMLHGTECEPLARAAYETLTGDLVQEVGFIVHPRIPRAGASCDGLVGDDGLVEFKCPKTATHIDTMLAGRVPAKYLQQCLWQMAVTGRKWCDFVSYDPRMPEHLRLWMQRVVRDEERIQEMEAAVVGFLAEVERDVERLRKVEVAL